MTYANQTQYDRALPQLQEALECYQETGDISGMGDVSNDMGFIYYHQGNYAQAIVYSQQALEIRQEIGDKERVAITLLNLASAQSSQGRSSQAMESYLQALALHREVNNRLGEAATLNGIGMQYDKQGYYAQSLAHFYQALVIVQELEHRYGEGVTLNNIGGIYELQGRYDDALDYFEQALVMKRNAGDRYGEGVTHNNIGAMYFHQGNYDEALNHFEQALEIHREIGDQGTEGATLSNIAETYQQRSSYEKALDYFQQALTVAQRSGQRFIEGHILTNLGRIYYEQGKYKKALEIYQDALTIHRQVGNRAIEGTTLEFIGTIHIKQSQPDRALDRYEEAISIFEDIRATAGSDEARASFIAQHAHVYARAITLYHQQGQDEQAFVTSERGRARSFLDSLATGTVQLDDNEARDLFDREMEAYAVRQAAQEALAKSRATDPPDEELIADLEQQLANAEQEHAAALDAIEARGGQLAALVPGRSNVLDVAGVQALLDEQTTLVSYVVGEDSSFAFILTRNSFHTIEIDAGSEELTSMVRIMHSTPPVADGTPPLEATTLYQTLITPLKDHLTTSHLAIIPHGVLHYLPFAALSPDGTSYLIDDYTLTLLPSATSLQYIRENMGNKSNTALVVGNPASPAPGLAPLYHAEQEAETIATLYGTEPLLRDAATESAVREQAAGAGVLHLAAHGEFNLANPLYSTIYLAPGDEGGEGRLEVHEIYSLDLQQADMVVLSACETNLPRPGRGHSRERRG
jgi:tetratricopeptide (TPR) repeat protein